MRFLNSSERALKICPRTRVVEIKQQVVPQQLLAFEERGDVVHVRRLKAGQRTKGALVEVRVTF